MYKANMFQYEQSTELDAEELLKNYLYLDKELFKKRKDDSIEQGNACFKKFSNEGKGVVLPLRMKLDALATLIRENKYTPQNTLAFIDVFTLYSNHLDQQRFNEKPEPKEKERLVLNYLEAAFALDKKYDYEHLEQYNARELSSHAQLLHYLGKARRYAGISAEERLPLLLNALKIAKHLSRLNCDEVEDPHHYENRIATYELPVNYCLQDLKQYDKAAELIKPQLELSSAFHRAQALIQLANIYIKQHQDFGKGIDVAEQYALRAVKESVLPESSPLINYNARVCLMNVLEAADKTEDAQSIAHAIIDEMDKNSECGAKPTHREAVEKIINAHNACSL
jgi:tetratricopeptide (TPR) repeat protein